MWCNVLPCVAVCVVVYRSALQCVAVCCSVLHCVAVCCNASHTSLCTNCRGCFRRRHRYLCADELCLLQCVADELCLLQCVADELCLLQCVADELFLLQCVADELCLLQCVTDELCLLQCVAVCIAVYGSVCCSVLQCVAVFRSASHITLDQLPEVFEASAPLCICR